MHIYGFIIGISLVLGYLFFEKEAKKYHIEHVDTLFISVILWAIVGARIYHVITDFSLYYPNHLINILYIWNGGLGIYGGVFGGIIGYFLWKKITHSKIHTTLLLDIAGSILPLCQSIGRWGNFFNQELYGKPTTLPIGIFIDQSHRVIGYEQFQYFHPLFLYESITLFLLWIFIHILMKNARFALGKGRIFSLYLIAFSCIRFGLDFLRIHPSMIGVLTTAQWVSIVLFLIGVIKYAISNANE